MIVPEEELVPKPTSWMLGKLPGGIISEEDNFRKPQRVCDTCSYQLKDIQGELRQQVSRANQETVVDTSSRMPNLPSVQFFLEDEIRKATTMLLSFKHNLGEERIPKELLDMAKGVVFLTVVKAGFMFSGRYGTGIVLAKLDDGSWSAPSAVTLSGLGWGLQVGAELTDVMLILSTEYAVKTFKSRAQISIGAELGVSVGPIGRSIESDVTAGNKGATHAFSYAQSKGLFMGASLEASGIASRPDVNRAFYGEKVTPSVLLSGEYPSPKGAAPLYKALDEVMHIGKRTAGEAEATYRERYLARSSTAENVTEKQNNGRSSNKVTDKQQQQQQISTASSSLHPPSGHSKAQQPTTNASLDEFGL